MARFRFNFPDSPSNGSCCDRCKTHVQTHPPCETSVKKPALIRIMKIRKHRTFKILLAGNRGSQPASCTLSRFQTKRDTDYSTAF
jgi:hypothetical protein